MEDTNIVKHISRHFAVKLKKPTEQFEKNSTFFESFEFEKNRQKKPETSFQP